MKELTRSNDAIFLSWLVNALEQAGLKPVLLDQHMSVLEGSIGILPRRVLIADDELKEAQAILEAGPQPAVIEGIVVGAEATTADSLLGGKIVFYQPAEGYRAAIDPVLLAAAVPAQAGDAVLDLGCGAGAATLCLAHRVPDCRVVGLEIDPALVALARTNAGENGFGNRVEIVAGNAVAPPATIASRQFDCVMVNPPYRAEGSGTPSPDAARQRANEETSEADLAAWIAAALRLVKPKGTIVLIHRADRLDDAIAALHGQAGEIAIVPLWPKSGRPAKRVILRARKGIRAGVRLLPGLVLHEAGGEFTRAADAILREGGALGGEG